jgi:hypothetical protein
MFTMLPRRDREPPPWGSRVKVPTTRGVEIWSCWPDQQGDMFAVIERPDGSVVTIVSSRRTLPVREVERWR